VGTPAAAALDFEVATVAVFVVVGTGSFPLKMTRDNWTMIEGKPLRS